MSDPTFVTTRRERLRTAALAEIREHGYAQIAQGGAGALSLNGIAKAMGMSGPAMYRYFASRDALLTTLITESYEALAGALSDAAHAARRRGPEGRLMAVAVAYRAWVLAEPHRYRLILASDLSTQVADPERIIAAAQKGMDILLDALADLTPPDDLSVPAGLARDLVRWGAQSSRPDAAPALYLRAQSAWTRLHGLLSLEIEGVYRQMGLDPGQLYASEVGRL